MTAFLPCTAALVPLSWLAASLLATRTDDYRQQRARVASGVGGLLALAAAVVALVALIRVGPTTVSVPGAAAVLLSLRIDAISVTMALLIAFVGLVVVRFSHGYLGGDPRQAAFLRFLCQTLAAVSLLVLAGNVLLLWLAWVATSVSLHRLLLFYPERGRARLAAGKKFFLARCGDVALAISLGLLAHAAASPDIAVIGERLRAGAVDIAAAPAFLLVLAALLKSAQFPTHGWLAEVVEAPTPVSALLHAGIVNAGGFLVIRFADLVAGSGAALYTLLLVGGITALFGALVMMTQRSIKGALAYSTVSQMGFMLLQCGLGAFSSAILHIVAHSLYKAHAFLASGSVVDVARGNTAQATAAPVRPWLILASLLLAGAIFALWSLLAGITPATKPAIVGLGAILVFGAMHLIIQSSRERGTPVLLLRAGFAATAVAGLYFTLQTAAAMAFENTVPAAGALDSVQLVLMTLMLLTFGTVTALQWYLPAMRRSPRWQAFWVHLANGFYVNQLINQFIALRESNARASH